MPNRQRQEFVRSSDFAKCKECGWTKKGHELSHFDHDFVPVLTWMYWAEYVGLTVDQLIGMLDFDTQPETEPMGQAQVEVLS